MERNKKDKIKWIYGKQDWKTFERGLENCYLTANGLGGFSSLTMTGAVSRNDHAVLMASIKAPNCRYNILHRIKEQVKIKEKEYVISSQEFADKTKENGWRYKSADQFLSGRESTQNQTILAGYPFFEDWGRDTMIALPGICLSTKRYESARSILRTFAKYEKNGLMPNVFPEGGNNPFYLL